MCPVLLCSRLRPAKAVPSIQVNSWALRKSGIDRQTAWARQLPQKGAWFLVHFVLRTQLLAFIKSLAHPSLHALLSDQKLCGDAVAHSSGARSPLLGVSRELKGLYLLAGNTQVIFNKHSLEHTWFVSVWAYISNLKSDNRVWLVQPQKVRHPPHSSWHQGKTITPPSLVALSLLQQNI